MVKSLTGEIQKRNSRLFGLAIAIFLMMVSFAIGIPYYQTHIAPWYKPVLQVKERTFNRKQFINRLRLQLTGENPNPRAISIRLIEEIQNQELSHMEAEKRGLHVTDQEVDLEVRHQVKRFADGEGDFDQVYEAMLRKSRLDAGEFEALVRANLIQRKLFNSFLSEIPDKAGHVFIKVIATATPDEAETLRTRLARGVSFSRLASETSIDLKSSKAGGDMGWIPKGVWELKATSLVCARGILVKTLAEADLIRAQVQAGRDFSQLAKTVSLDNSSRDQRGYLGWVSSRHQNGKQFLAETDDLGKGMLSGPLKTQEGFWILQVIEKSPAGNVFDDFIFDMPVGSVTPPLAVNQGFFLFKVVERKDQRPLIPKYRQILAGKRMQNWLWEAAQRGSKEKWIKWYWDSDSLNWVLNNLDK